ncbi:diacylglycerol/lipid kinase family protein [Glaciibacter superstes]|uniref:diacylglycerol/lipid kinase family protein n=1 Tax=Glaciibacter superstes TaxID=501023 RepID=UPI0003B3D4B8|nr:diacylglycerol kinase family protein [Glaciibacter superstes]
MATTSLRIAVAINPEASFGKRRDVGPRVTEALRSAGHDVVSLTEANIELLRRETQAAFERGVDLLVVVGGDGMVSLGTNVVAGTGVPMAVVACGTGNDLALGLGIPAEDTETSVAFLLESLSRPPRAIDAARVRQGGQHTWYAGALSAGFDAIVNERANRMTFPRGRSRYTWAILRELATLSPIDYRITVDGVERRVRALLVSVANNVSIGGGMRIAPTALIDDGFLDLFIVTPMSRLAFLRVFPKVFSGTHIQLKQVELSRCRSVRIEAEGIVAYADGERIGTLPVEIDVVPGALLVRV